MTTDVSTRLHDQIHLWLYQLPNRYKLLQYVAAKKGYLIDKDSFSSSIDLERPIMIGQSRKFICDCILDLVDIKNCGGPPKDGYKLITVKSFSGKDISVISGSISRRLIIEIKSQLLSVSSAISQIKTYQYYLRYNRWYQGVKSERLSNGDLVLLTLDATDSYDKMLFDQMITVFHIPPKEIKR